MNRRRLVVTASAALTVLAVQAGGTSAVSADVVPLPPGSHIRLAGADRFATAVEVSKATFNGPVPVAYIANGMGFADALSGSPAAATQRGPLLLVSASSIPAVVGAELTRLQPGRIVVLGGTSVVGNAVATALDAYTAGSVTRLSGADRYATSAAVATSVFSDARTKAYIAYGLTFPDALSGGAPAGDAGGPLLLSPSTTMPPSVVDALDAVNPTEIVFLGSTGVLAPSLQTQLEDSGRFPGLTYTRLGGSTRFETSANISFGSFVTADVAFVTVGDNFPDALAGAVSAGVNGGPILLSQKTCMPAPTFDELADLAPAKVVLLGGSGVLADSAPTTRC